MRRRRRPPSNASAPPAPQSSPACHRWKPTVGAIQEIAFQSAPSVWGYFSVKAPQAAVHAFADSQFGHLFAWGPTRTAAARNLMLALRRLRVVGEIHTNVQYVQAPSSDYHRNHIITHHHQRAGANSHHYHNAITIVIGRRDPYAHR